MLNPFFQQGSKSEQNLVQDLINEQLRMYGVDVYYIPRLYVNEKTIIREVVESEFRDAYPIEAYVDTSEGYEGSGEIMSKFGIESQDDLTLTISRERYEEYIKPLIENKGNIKLSKRPKEGDLIFFPLGNRLFEIKFVEHEQPFYQLKKNYVYQLRCELFRYNDEVIDTDVDAIDNALLGADVSLGIAGSSGAASLGIGANLAGTRVYTMLGIGATASSVGTVFNGGVRYVSITNRGTGYTSTPDIAFSAPVNRGWVTTLSGSGSDIGRAIKLDNSNNLYVSGTTSSDGAGNVDFLLAKYDTSGALISQVTLGGSDLDSQKGTIGIDDSNNVYLSGQTRSTENNDADLLLAKYNSSGTIQWQRSLSGIQFDSGESIAVGGSGNSYVVGATQSDGAGNSDIVVAKYNTSGDIQWQRNLGETASDYATSVAIDSSENVYVGAFGSSVGAGGNDLIIAKYDAGGNIQWQRTLGGVGSESDPAIEVTDSGVYITSNTTSLGGNNLLIAKYNTSGTIQWQKTLGGTGIDIGRGITSDNLGNIYVIGTTNSTEASGPGGTDILLAKYNSIGSIQWQRVLGSSGGTNTDFGYGIEFGSDFIYVTGYTGSTESVFIAKLPADGSVISLPGTYTYSASSLTDQSVSLTSSSSVLIDQPSALTSGISTLTSSVSTLISTPGTSTAVGIATMIAGIVDFCEPNYDKSRVQGVRLSNTGYGYISDPIVRAIGGGGKNFVGSATTATGVVGIITVTDGGNGYSGLPTITFSAPVGSGATAIAEAVVSTAGTITAIHILDAGAGYATTNPPTITIEDPYLNGSGDFVVGETVVGSSSSVTATVRYWNSTTRQLNLAQLTGEFNIYDEFIGEESGARHKATPGSIADKFNMPDPFADNSDFQTEANDILDFTETNPFGRP
tara:strand:+ start:652 stop:3366 length:2715 start_codon:yes stop_codon:yes gene_type:complete